MERNSEPAGPHFLRSQLVKILDVWADFDIRPNPFPDRVRFLAEARTIEPEPDDYMILLHPEAVAMFVHACRGNLPVELDKDQLTDGLGEWGWQDTD